MTVHRVRIEGQQVHLEEAIEFPKNAVAILTILTEEEQREREEWSRFGLQQMSRAYGNDEPEYTDEDIIRE